MKTISGKKMCKILKKRGWIIARISGSHHIFIKEGSNLRITVPVHSSSDLKKGLQRLVMKQAGISDFDL